MRHNLRQKEENHHETTVKQDETKVTLKKSYRPEIPQENANRHRRDKGTLPKNGSNYRDAMDA